MSYKIEFEFPSPYGEEVSATTKLKVCPLLCTKFPSPYGEEVSATGRGSIHRHHRFFAAAEFPSPYGEEVSATRLAKSEVLRK